MWWEEFKLRVYQTISSRMERISSGLNNQHLTEDHEVVCECQKFARFLSHKKKVRQKDLQPLQLYLRALRIAKSRGYQGSIIINTTKTLERYYLVQELIEELSCEKETPTIKSPSNRSSL